MFRKYLDTFSYSETFDQIAFGLLLSNEPSEDEHNEQIDEQFSQLPNQPFSHPADQSIDQLVVQQFIQPFRGEGEDTFNQGNKLPFNERQAETFNEQRNETGAGEDQHNNQNPPTRQRKPKTKVDLTRPAKEFKERFKLILKKTGADPRKIKEMVQICHKAVHTALHLPDLNRNQQRSLDLYFRDFCPYQNVLLPSFEQWLLNCRNTPMVINHG